MNRWVGIGRLTADPEVRSTGSGKRVASYKLAVDRRFKQEGQQEADFIPCIVFGGGADFAEKYLRKGMKIAVEGRIQVRSYEDKHGGRSFFTEIVLESQEFCESKKQGGGSNIDDLKQFPGVQFTEETDSEETLPF